MNIIIPVIIAVIMVAAVFILGIKTDMLKDTSTAQKKPYSFSRVQLAWWLVIITSCYVLILFNRCDWLVSLCGATPNPSTCDIISNSALILLGISVSTTAAGKLIDTSQNTINRHQNMNSDGFLLDILSDSNGVSIHRLQALVFNIIFGALFIIKIVHSLKSTTTCVCLPDFSDKELMLLGLSSGTYAALKVNENSAS